MTTPDQSKTMADVADKAVDKLAGGIEAVAKAVERVAPHVWETLVRQHMAEGAVRCVFGAMGVAIVAYLLLLTKRNWSAMVGATKYEFPPAPYILAMILLFCLFFALSFVSDGALRCVNPQYYAAKELIAAAR